jgi:hypothetical protein
MKAALKILLTFSVFLFTLSKPIMVASGNRTGQTTQYLSILHAICALYSLNMKLHRSHLSRVMSDV